VLCIRLKDRGIDYWRDSDTGIAVGSDILTALTRAIVAYDKVLLCCSQFSLTSSWVHEEIDLALDKEQKLQRNVLLPLDIDGYLRSRWTSPYASLLNRRLAADFVGWQDDKLKLERSFEQVASALKLA
jgi:TIR domain-containing protein